jgi:predicted lipoprotein with Yx(FWY)xxD motif
MRRTLIPVLAIVAAALAAAGCGSSNKSTSSTTAQAASAPAPAAAVSTTAESTTASAEKGETIVLTTSKLGKILRDEDGKTLYLFEADKSTQSTCDGACAKDWPPVTTSGDPVAEHGATASMLGTTMRSDGKTQVTYGGHPLYYYVGDDKPGQMNGQDSHAFGAGWYVVGATGKKVEPEGGDDS